MTEYDKIEFYRNQSTLYNEEVTKYKSCMEEIALRSMYLKDFAASPPSQMLDYQKIEYMCLQIRMLIELVLLSSLVANQRYYTKGLEKLKTEWRITSINNFLESVNKDYYPVPVEFIKDETQNTIRIEKLTGGFLTKEDLIDAYDTCCDYAHAENPFNNKRDYKIAYSKLKGWVEGIHRLTANHTIQLEGISQQFGVMVFYKKPVEVYVIYLRMDDLT